MPTYVGVNNVSRNVPSYRASVGGVTRTIGMAYGGVSGVARPILGKWVDLVSHIELKIDYFRTYTILVAENWQYDDKFYNRSDILPRSTITITTNAIHILCSDAGRGISVEAVPYIVFKDGTRQTFYTVGDFPFSITVGYSLSFSSGEGAYMTSFMNVQVVTGYIHNGASGSITITNTTPEFSKYNDVYVGAGRINGGTTVSQQSYSNIIIDGVSLPVRVIDNLG